jgi:hypothetical protein
MRNGYEMLIGKHERRGHFEELVISGMIILRWMTRFKVAHGRVQVVDSCEHDNEPWGFIKGEGGEFLDQLSNSISFSGRTLILEVGF